MKSRLKPLNPVLLISYFLFVGILVLLTACSIITPTIDNQSIERKTSTPTTIASMVIKTITPTETATVISSPTHPSSTLTSTPQPIPPSLKSFQLVYQNSVNIELWKGGKTSVIARFEGEPQYMDYIDYINTSPLAYSDDGEYVAFIQWDGGIWAIHPDGTGKKNLFNMSALDYAYNIRPYLIGWLPNTHTILFSQINWLQTSLYALDGSFSTANVDTGVVKKYVLFPNIGANFFLSPDGKSIAVVKGHDVYAVDVNGKNLRKLFTSLAKSHYFPYGLGYFGHPIQPIWDNGSQYFVIVLPPTNPKDTMEMQVEVWQVYIDGKPAKRLNRFTTSTISEYSPEAAVWISPDLSRLVYLKQKQGQDNLKELHIASMDMSEDRTISVGSYGKVYWAPNSKQFVIRQSSEDSPYLFVDLDGNTHELTDMAAGDLTWIDNENLLLFDFEGAFWLINVNNQAIPLIRIDYSIPIRYFRQFDFTIK